MEHLRISTMTAVAKLCTDIDIEKMYNSLRIDDIVKFIEFKKQYKGYSKKLEKKTRKKKEKRTFYNQAKVSLVPLNNTVQPSGQSVSLQSLSVGIPVIISDTDGNWFNGEKISSEFIYTAKQNTIESWNHLFENIYQESNDYEKISKRMSGYIKDNLDKSVFDLNLKKIILDILDQN